jgi:hypothetical protein
MKIGDMVTTVICLDGTIDSAIRITAYTENDLNDAIVRHYLDNLTPQLLRLIAETDLEYGYTSVIDTFIRNRLHENAAATKEWVGRVFVSHIHDSAVTTGLLRTISHLEYHEFAPSGLIMAMAALSHADPVVRECGIRAFESWAVPDSLQVLRNVVRQNTYRDKCREQWLTEYLEHVITDLEREVGAPAPSS